MTGLLRGGESCLSRDGFASAVRARPGLSAGLPRPASHGRRHSTDDRQMAFRSGALQVGRGLLADAPVGDLKLVGNLLALSEAAHACALDGADVHEHVLAALI